MQQDVKLYSGVLGMGDSVTYSLPPQRYAWLQVVKGAVKLNNTPLSVSDGAAISEENTLTINATEDAEILLFDLA